MGTLRERWVWLVAMCENGVARSQVEREGECEGPPSA